MKSYKRRKKDALRKKLNLSERDKKFNSNRSKLIPYEETEEMKTSYRTNTKMTFIGKIKKSKWNK